MGISLMRLYSEKSKKIIFHQFLRLMKLIQPFWPSLLRSIKISAIASIFGLVLPYTSKLLIDEVFPSQNITLMHVIVIGTLVFSLSHMFLGTLRSYYSTYVSSVMGSTVSLMFFNHLQYLPITFYEQHRVGEITSRFTDVRSSLNSVTQILSDTLINIWYLILVPPVLFFLQWKLAIASLIVIPISGIITFYSGKTLRRFWKRSAEAYAEVNAIQVEVLSQIRTFKSMAVENLMYRRTYSSLMNALRSQFQAIGTSQLFGISNGFLSLLNTAIYTWLGWTFILDRQMTLGEYIAFSSYVGYLYGPILNFAKLFHEYQQASIGLNRMFEYLDVKPEQSPIDTYQDDVKYENNFNLVGSIEFNNVSFGYEKDKAILHDISFAIPAGSIFCIFGPNGGGKTTLMRLLTRFNECSSGKILIDGVSINNIPLIDLRRQISIVMQEIGFIRGTIWDNLTLMCDNPSKAAVEEAVRICQLEKMIAEMSHGLETSLSEWGASISGGQRQRLAIARVLVRQTPILILDEATSNIDVLTETEILRELSLSRCGRTTILITHRIGSALLADQICVMDMGRIVGIGTHQNLLKDNPLYSRMYKIATGDQREGKYELS